MKKIGVYARTELSQHEKETFYASLDSIFDRYPSRDTLIGFGNFSAVTGTKRAGYKLCVDPHDSDKRNVNRSFPLNFAKSRTLSWRSWFQTRYSNAGGVVKEIDHILDSTLLGSFNSAGFTAVSSPM